MSGVQLWHDEADRFNVWHALDPTDACMCTDCILGATDDPTDHKETNHV